MAILMTQCVAAVTLDHQPEGHNIPSLFMCQRTRCTLAALTCSPIHRQCYGADGTREVGSINIGTVKPQLEFHNS